MLDRELLTGVGDMNFYARDNEGRSVVVELKWARATQEAVHQLSRYAQAVRTFLPAQTGGHPGILSARGISAPARVALEGLQLEFREIHALPAAQEAAAQPQLFWTGNLSRRQQEAPGLPCGVLATC